MGLLKLRLRVYLEHISHLTCEIVQINQWFIMLAAFASANTRCYFDIWWYTVSLIACINALLPLWLWLNQWEGSSLERFISLFVNHFRDTTDGVVFYFYFSSTRLLMLETFFFFLALFSFCLSTFIRCIKCIFSTFTHLSELRGQEEMMNSSYDELLNLHRAGPQIQKSFILHDAWLILGIWSFGTCLLLLEIGVGVDLLIFTSISFSLQLCRDEKEELKCAISLLLTWLPL